MKNYLKNANELLINDSICSPYRKVETNKELVKLMNNTIYIPEYAVTNFNANTSSYDNVLADDINKLFSKYPYKYEIVKSETLEYRISQPTEPVYYLSFIRTVSSKQITIYNSVTGSIIYNKYDLTDNNLSTADFKEITKAIESLLK